MRKLVNYAHNLKLVHTVDVFNVLREWTENGNVKNPKRLLYINIPNQCLIQS